MQTLFYRVLARLSGIFGAWFFDLVSGGIAVGYFLLFPRRVAVGMRFYRALYPHRGRIHHLGCTLRQFIDFTRVFRDRLLPAHAGTAAAGFTGVHHLQAAAGRSGGILLMSHMGNWEVAARLLRRSLPDLRLMLYMGVKEKEQIEALQKAAVRRSDIRIVGVDADGGSPLDIVEGIRFIRGGGLVSITGDRVWRPGQRTLDVRFLGRTVPLPAAPYVLAIASGAPIFVFFALRNDRGGYDFSAAPPITVAAARSGRQAAMTEAAQQYADRLEATVRRHPFQWHHFEAFLE